MFVCWYIKRTPFSLPRTARSWSRRSTVPRLIFGRSIWPAWADHWSGPAVLRLLIRTSRNQNPLFLTNLLFFSESLNLGDILVSSLCEDSLCGEDVAVVQVHQDLLEGPFFFKLDNTKSWLRPSFQLVLPGDDAILSLNPSLNVLSTPLEALNDAPHRHPILTVAT